MLPDQTVGLSDANRDNNGSGGEGEFAVLRQLLLGPEQQRLDALTDRIDAMGLTAAEVAEQLPEAIALRASRDQQLGRALAPTVETALRESIRRNPREIAAAIFPILGPAIRKAISEAMTSLVRSINGAVEHSLSTQGIRWRLESWRTGVPFADIVIKHALVYRVEQVYLIHAETGLLLAHVSAKGTSAPDADIISSMLSAIQDFVRDSFQPGEGATLRTFTVGEQTVQVESGPRALLAAVIRGDAPTSMTARLQQTLESVHLEFASPLVEFSGDDAPFQPVRPLLEQCLTMAVATRPAGTPGRLVWVRWALPLALLALVVVGLTIRSSLRWRRAIRALNAEPGLVLVDASRGWGGWHFRGLRDPVAHDPRAVLTAAGFTTAPASSRWEPYLSLDSGIVVERARRGLSAPPSVQATLRGDTLTLRGTAPLEWASTVASAGSFPGVRVLDVNDVQPTLPSGLDSARRTIESSRILYDAGSAELVPAADAQLRDVAALIRRLVDGVTSAGAAIVVRVIGRTDASGSDASNESLAQRRIDDVTGRLSSLGIAPATLHGEALATSRPLTGSSGEETSRINRSVSFEVTIRSVPLAAGRR
jgi:OOP family OmpA-OmpF porin